MFGRCAVHLVLAGKWNDKSVILTYPRDLFLIKLYNINLEEIYLVFHNEKYNFQVWNYIFGMGMDQERQVQF